MAVEEDPCRPIGFKKYDIFYRIICWTTPMLSSVPNETTDPEIHTIRDINRTIFFKYFRKAWHEPVSRGCAHSHTTTHQPKRERASAITGTDNSVASLWQVCGQCRSVPVLSDNSAACLRRVAGSNTHVAGQQQANDTRREAVGGTTSVVSDRSAAVNQFYDHRMEKLRVFSFVIA